MEAATAPALKVTPLRTNELAPAGKEPVVKVKVIMSALAPDEPVNLTMLVAVRVAHGVEVVAVKLAPVAIKQEFTTEGKATKKPVGKTM